MATVVVTVPCARSTRGDIGWGRPGNTLCWEVTCS